MDDSKQILEIEKFVGKTILCGTFLGDQKNNQNIQFDKGFYFQNSKIYASITGQLKIQEKKNEQNIIQKFANIQRNDNNSAAILKIGAVIIGKVNQITKFHYYLHNQITRIKEEMAFVKILIIDGQQIRQNLEGIIRKINIRETEIDKIQMEKIFIPGDIVKTHLISYSDSSKILLSTAGEQYGVIFAKHQETKKLMIPFNWQEMICITSGLKEHRKVANPEKQNYEPMK